MAFNKGNIPLRDDSTPGYLNATNPITNDQYNTGQKELAEAIDSNLEQDLIFIDLTPFTYGHAQDFRIDTIQEEPGINATIVLSGTSTPYVLGDTVSAFDKLDISVDSVAGSGGKSLIKINGTLL